MPHALRLHRILKAPRPLVWRCWTEADLLKPWFVPAPHTVISAEVDPRPGGRFHTVMKVDGTEYPNDGCFLHVAPQTALVFTDMMLAGWQPVSEPGLGFTAELTFADHPDGTEYTAIARHRTAEDAERHEAMGFSEGWGIAATQLETLARSLI